MDGKKSSVRVLGEGELKSLRPYRWRKSAPPEILEAAEALKRGDHNKGEGLAIFFNDKRFMELYGKEKVIRKGRKAKVETERRPLLAEKQTLENYMRQANIRYGKVEVIGDKPDLTPHLIVVHGPK